MNTDFIKGVVVPILTPIDGDERIDEAKLREQVDYVIDGGVLGILAFGSNGEFYVIEEDEMLPARSKAGEELRYSTSRAPARSVTSILWISAPVLSSCRRTVDS